MDVNNAGQHDGCAKTGLGQNQKEKAEEDLTSYRLQNASYFKIILRKHENKLEFPCISRRFLLPLRMQIIKQ